MDGVVGFSVDFGRVWKNQPITNLLCGVALGVFFGGAPLYLVKEGTEPFNLKKYTPEV